MTKHLTKTGNSYAVVIDRPVLEATEIGPETPLEISTDGDVIIISPVRDHDRIQKLREGMTKIHHRYAAVFRRLA
jgi:antitoxin component of MazEF toxin-antitoxin module